MRYLRSNLELAVLSKATKTNPMMQFMSFNVIKFKYVVSESDLISDSCFSVCIKLQTASESEYRIILYKIYLPGLKFSPLTDFLHVLLDMMADIITGFNAHIMYKLDDGFPMKWHVSESEH